MTGGVPAAPVRVLVHNDQQYWWSDHALWTRQPFARFVCAIGEHGVHVTLCGRLEPGDPTGGVPLDPRAGFAGLPTATARGGALRMLRSAPVTVRRWWRALAVHDVVWLVGPNVWSLPFAFAARLRGVPVVLGVRQDLPVYVRFRHPGRRRARVAAAALDMSFRWLARRRPAVVVGAVLAGHYRHAPAVLDIRVALTRRSEVAEAASEGGGERRPRAVSVGRLDPEKNPLLLADVMALAPDWELHVCGDGPLLDALRDRARELGCADRVIVHGRVDGPALGERYADADALLHVSWTEGVPQVILEAFAAGLPVVATDVGGVADATRGAALVVPVNDPMGAAAALQRLADEPDTARRLAESGLALAREHSLESESAAVARLLRAQVPLRDRYETPAAAPPEDRPADRSAAAAGPGR